MINGEYSLRLICNCCGKTAETMTGLKGTFSEAHATMARKGWRMNLTANRATCPRCVREEHSGIQEQSKERIRDRKGRFAGNIGNSSEHNC